MLKKLTLKGHEKRKPKQSDEILARKVDISAVLTLVSVLRALVNYDPHMIRVL